MKKVSAIVLLVGAVVFAFGFLLIGFLGEPVPKLTKTPTVSGDR